MRRRSQNGSLEKVNGFWVLRYRERVMKDGQLVTVRRAKQIAAVDAQHKTAKSVEGLAAETLQPLNERRYSPETVMQLGQFVESIYLPYVEGQKRASTASDYRNRWKLYLEPRCSGWWLRETRTCDVQQLMDSVAREHDLSVTTLKHIKHLLGGIFTAARQQGYFDSANPVTGAKIPKARPAGETQAYSLREEQTMIAVLPEPAATIAAVAGFAGLRRGEIRGLEWTDYTGDALHVNRSNWNGISDDPKTAKSRAAVPVIPFLRGMLDAHRQRCGNPGAGPIFANGKGKPMSLDSLCRRLMRPVLDSKSIAWKGWHAFRRGLGTVLHDLGVDDLTIQAVLRLNEGLGFPIETLEFGGTTR
jgi:integrase